MAYTGAYIFGDSLVDSGNALKLAKFYGTLTFSDLPEGAPDPALGYFQGRFSDGYTFADLISNKAIGLVSKPVFPFHFEDPLFGIPIDPFAGDPSGNNLNFAYGGAQIIQGGEVVPDFDGQTDAFKDAVDGHADPNALYMFTIGSNDVRSLAPVGSDPTPTAQAYSKLQAAADKMLHELQQLADAGVKNLLITGIADVGLIPKYDLDGNHMLQGSELARSQAGTLYSQYLDGLIRSQVLPALQSRGLNVTYVPLMDYTAHNGTQVTGALSAILPELAALNGLTVGDLTQHLLDHQSVVFFDQIHPNAQAHALMASYANAQLTGQPWIERPLLQGADVDYRSTGSIGVAGEVDKLVVAMVSGTTYTFQMLGVSSLTAFTLGQLGLSSLGAPGALVGDTSIKLLSGSTVVASDDDSGMGLDSQLAFTATAAGSYTLALSALGSLTGNYAVTATVTGAAMNVGNSYTVNNSSTLVIEGAGGVGQDTVLASVNYALTTGSEIEVLRTTNDKGKGALNLTGNEFAQTIVGNTGANVIEGKGGADTLYGGKGNDSFVLSADALTSSANIDHIMDYGSGDVVDISQILKVAAGTNVVSSGYVRVTSSGLVQVDLDGGANNWVTLSTINGTDPVAIRYFSGDSLATVTASRVSDAAAILSGSQQQALGFTSESQKTVGGREDWHAASSLDGLHYALAAVSHLDLIPF